MHIPLKENVDQISFPLEYCFYTVFNFHSKLLHYSMYRYIIVGTTTTTTIIFNSYIFFSVVILACLS